MGQMAAVGQIHAQYGVAGLDERKVDRHVGLCAGVGLYVDMLRAKKLVGPVDGQVFHLIHALAAAVVALAGITLGVFVGQNRRPWRP